MNIIKFILGSMLFLLVQMIIITPFKLVIDGFIILNNGSDWGIVFIVVGCILLRLIKPISILTGKDYKIF